MQLGHLVKQEKTESQAFKEKMARMGSLEKTGERGTKEKPERLVEMVGMH